MSYGLVTEKVRGYSMIKQSNPKFLAMNKTFAAFRQRAKNPAMSLQ